VMFALLIMFKANSAEYFEISWLTNCSPNR
jgi:hypothetical protein